MADNTKIEWCSATWNPVRGCSIVSKGCTNCYAMRQAHRSHGAGGAYEGLTKLTKGGPVWTGEVRTVPELLEQPLRGGGRGASS
jgi:protein gp37